VDVRSVLLVVAVLALVGGVNVWRWEARPAAPQETRPYERFSAKVVGRTERPASSLDQQFASLNAMWSKAFADSGARYRPPKLALRRGDECVSSGAAWAGTYCPTSEEIVLDLDAHAGRYAAVGAGVSELVLGYILAHEVGHHVQHLRGAPKADPQHELQAECLAGVWGKAAGLQLPPTWAYGEDAVHGTAYEQIQWLNVGYRSGRPADCDAIWDPGRP